MKLAEQDKIIITTITKEVFMKSTFLALTLGLLSSPSFAKEKEPLLGVTYDFKTITFQVKSGGCTKKKDFEVLIAKSDPATLELVRHKEDKCEAVMPNGTTIQFTYKELGLSQKKTYSLKNTVTPEAISVWLEE